MFGTRLKQARELRGLTQEALGELLSVSRQQVQRWESGGAEPNAKTLRSMAQHLNVTSDYLLGLADSFNDHATFDDITPDEWRVIRAMRSGIIKEAIEATVEATK